MTRTASRTPEPLAPAAAAALVARERAVFVDLRSPAEFAHAHPKGALSLAYSERGLDRRLSVVLPGTTPVVLLAADGPTADRAAAQLIAGGFAVLGYVVGGLAAWREAGLPMDSLGEIGVGALAQRADTADPVVLDVREPLEWETGHVPGATLIPLGELGHRLRELPRDAPIAVICEAGVRSATAASMLLREGFGDVANVPEGSAGWRRSRFPLAFPRRT